jgi:hypothetical protein
VFINQNKKKVFKDIKSKLLQNVSSWKCRTIFLATRTTLIHAFKQPGEGWLSGDRLRQGLLGLVLMRLGEGIGKLLQFLTIQCPYFSCQRLCDMKLIGFLKTIRWGF